jgi:glycosyltransferase involved in cell wall biosynthesis
VVTTTAGSIPEVVGDGARLVPAGDDGALADALGGLLADERERSRLAERGRARAAEYTWERAASGMAGLYRDAAGAAAGRGDR